MGAVYKHIYDTKKAERHPRTEGYERFLALLQRYVKRDDMKKHQMWTLDEFITRGWTGRNPAVPFTSDELVDQVVAYRARGYNLKVVKDFTHDTCRQKWKLGVIGILATHEVKGEFHSCMIPVAFSITPEESTHAYKTLLQFVIRILQ